MEKIRFGIVGSGYMAKLHSLALRNIGAYLWPKLPQIEMVRMADIVPQAAKDGAERWGWKSHTSDWKEVTRADDIDVVIIITPNNSHADIAIDAFEHGKHVFCEKPLSSTVAEAERMTKAAQASGKVNLVNFSYRTWPGVELARQLIREGELGEVLHFEGRYFQEYAADPELPFSWRFDKSVSGGGAFGDIGSHIMDIACALMGPVDSIAAKTKRFYEKRPVNGPNSKEVTVDDLTTSLVQFSNGALGSVHASWAATGHKCDLSFSVIGTKGSLSFSWERSNELHFFSADDPQRVGGFRRIMLGGIHPEADPFWYAQGQGLGYGEAFVITARRAIEAVINANTNAAPNFAQALHINRVIAGAFQAAEEDRWVKIEKTDAFD
ncbi:Gfo/Idh/MocA family protein [Rhizobium sp. X9]|uniref:Gfo/Idh/MocA family protein n=1 Tax=Rhizobium sp. X9 TaxID=2815360 RepID=UPI001C0DB510|nr:Gfo/Idh/MocA family oxidoreductase [Rhizobium sp. X9]